MTQESSPLIEFHPVPSPQLRDFCAPCRRLDQLIAMGNSSSKEAVKLGEMIGSGTFAKVYKAQWNGKTVAAKKLHRYLIEKKDVSKMFKDEWEMLSKLEHPNIVQYYTVILPQTTGDTTIIITELLAGDLRQLILDIRLGNNKKRSLSFRETVSIMTDVASGLEYLHGRKIVHRDLASKNILLTSTHQAKIADFGFARVFPDGCMQATADPGTLASRAPETFADNPWGKKVEYDGSCADVFSFGTVLLEVIIGHGPQKLSEAKGPDGQIIPEHFRRSADITEMGTEHPLRLLVLNCLRNVPGERPSASLILQQLRVLKEDTDVMRSRDNLTHAQNSLSIHRVTSDHYDYNFKVMLVGSRSVGKTSIIQRFVDPSSQFTKHPTTMQFAEHFQRLQMKGKSILLKVTDTSGESRMHSIVPQMYRGTTGVVLVFDVSDWNTLIEVHDWIELIKEQCGQVPLILVGNKSDLQGRQVDIRTAEQFSEEHDILMYFEVSAKTGENIEETFSALIETLIEQDERACLQRNGGACSEPKAVAPTVKGGKLKMPSMITVRERLRPTMVINDPDSIVLNADRPQNVPADSERRCPCALT